MSELNIAVVGATGVVGQAFLDLLIERQFPVNHVFPLASENSSGKRVQFGDKNLVVKSLKDFDPSQVNMAFFSAGSDVSKEYAPKFAEAGCMVIDNSSAFRLEPDVPLIIPEVNPEKIEQARERNIIANPNCSTIQMLVALKPIYDKVGISQINVATYQSVSGAGGAAIGELAKQTADLLNGQDPESKVFPMQMAFNVIPHIDTFEDNGYTREEMKMVWETKKILFDPHIKVNATAVRVPVFYAHSEAIHIQMKAPLSADEAKNILRQSPGIVLLDGPAKTQEYPTAITHGANEDAVFIGRVRQDLDDDCGLNLWVVADNVRKGGALNAIQIAELLT